MAQPAHAADDIKKDAMSRMATSASRSLKHDFKKPAHRPRASAALLEHIQVEYIRQPDTPLNQVANISVEDARTLQIVSPWEKGHGGRWSRRRSQVRSGVESRMTAGRSSACRMPPLTEDRRKELTLRWCVTDAENARIAVRNVRRDVIE